MSGGQRLVSRAVGVDLVQAAKAKFTLITILVTSRAPTRRCGAMAERRILPGRRHGDRAL